VITITFCTPLRVQYVEKKKNISITTASFITHVTCISNNLSCQTLTKPVTWTIGFALTEIKGNSLNQTIQVLAITERK
jgi:hypothetical protein